jgi:hypothetical protein
MVKMLVEAGADRNLREAEHGGTAAECARASVEVSYNPSCAAVAYFLVGFGCLVLQTRTSIGSSMYLSFTRTKDGDERTEEAIELA